MYFHRTRVGIFHIVERYERWHVLFEDENLGSYVTPRQAADDLAGGHTFSPGPGIDTSTLGISDDIGDWEKGKPNHA